MSPLFPQLNPEGSLILAPMEGVMDAPMRALMAEIGGFDFAVSEFIRVSQNVITAKHIRTEIPELTHPTTLPVQVQLLGTDPVTTAQTALEACIAGARAIDLNFGCPSPTVNRHCGGAALLRSPDRIFAMIARIREELPPLTPLSAKIRLGWEDPTEVFEVAKAVEAAGANWLTIHARTRQEKYKPGVHWDVVKSVRESLQIPIIANGDIFTSEDASNARNATQCIHLMMGRGVLANPWIAHDIRNTLQLSVRPSLLSGRTIASAILRFIDLSLYSGSQPAHALNRTKQWFAIANNLPTGVIAPELLRSVRHCSSLPELQSLLSA